MLTDNAYSFNSYNRSQTPEPPAAEISGSAQHARSVFGWLSCFASLLVNVKHLSLTNINVKKYRSSLFAVAAKRAVQKCCRYENILNEFCNMF